MQNKHCFLLTLKVSEQKLKTYQLSLSFILTLVGFLIVSLKVLMVGKKNPATVLLLKNYYILRRKKNLVFKLSENDAL